VKYNQLSNKWVTTYNGTSSHMKLTVFHDSFRVWWVLEQFLFFSLSQIWPVNRFWKSANMWWRYDCMKVRDYFLWTTLYGNMDHPVCSLHTRLLSHVRNVLSLTDRWMGVNAGGYEEKILLRIFFKLFSFESPKCVKWILILHVCRCKSWFIKYNIICVNYIWLLFIFVSVLWYTMLKY